MTREPSIGVLTPIVECGKLCYVQQRDRKAEKMAFIPTDLVAKAAIQYRLFGNDVINTLWFEKTDETEWNLLSLQDLAAVLYSWVTSHVLVNLSNELTVHSITVTDQSSETATSYYYSTADDPGEVVGQSLPANVCMTISFKSAARGRNYRGRNYISGIPTVSFNDNIVDASFANGILSAYEELPAAVGVLDCQHVIVSHFLDKAPRANGVTVPVISYGYHDRNIDSMRRRLNGRGS